MTPDGNPDGDYDPPPPVKKVGKKVEAVNDIQQVKREMEKKLEQETSKYEERIKQLEEKQRVEIERLMLAVKQSNKSTRTLFGPVLKENVNRKEKPEVKEKRPVRRRTESSLLKDFHVETLRVGVNDDEPVTTRSGVSRQSNATAAQIPPQRSTRSYYQQNFKVCPTY